MAYILSLEIRGTDLRTSVANMTEPARLSERGRRPLNCRAENMSYMSRMESAPRRLRASSIRRRSCRGETAEPSNGQG